MADLPKRPQWLQEIAENSEFSSGAGPFYTLSVDLVRGNGSTDKKPWAVEDFDTIMEFNLEFIKNPKVGDQQPVEITVWLVREETFVTDEKEYCNPDERILLWKWPDK